MTDLSDQIIRIHGIKGARSACRVMAKQPFILLSPENAALTHGAQWFGDLVKLVRVEFPTAAFRTILDCRGRLSGALAAIENGFDGVIINPLPPTHHDQKDRLSDLGRQSGCVIYDDLSALAEIFEMADHMLPDTELDRRLQIHLASLGKA
ncbi:MAG: hypothetical protein RIG26_00755 [Thalassospira sp.]|uniref:hypothetical protein n=1 Tax=Thalassospira sp. TaxID=1912094 RepID=UPI0032ECD0EC